MISRILVAVDDSPPALAAARYAVELAVGCGATVRAVTVLTDHTLTERLGQPEELIHRRMLGGDAVLRYVVTRAKEGGVAVETVLLDGEPAHRILEQARSWPADLVVMGRSDLRGTGQPYVGRETRHVLEFADVPVLVVPRRR